MSNLVSVFIGIYIFVGYLMPNGSFTAKAF